MKLIDRLNFTVLLVLLTSSISLADPGNNNGLYAPVAPDDSAYIRLINLSTKDALMMVKGKTSEMRVSSYTIGEFVFVPEGTVVVDVAGNQFEADMVANDVISLVLTNGKLVEFKDNFFTNRRKSMVIFYNMAPMPLSLKTPDGKFNLVEDVAFSNNQSREINEIKIGLGLFDSDQKIKDIAPHFYQKGRSYSYLAYEKEGGVGLIQSDDSVASLQ